MIALLGGGGSAALIGLGLDELLDSDYAEAPPTDHYLTDPQASLYAERYNRKLLRKTVRELRKVHQETSAAVRPVTVLPYVGPGGAGVVGRF